MVCIGTAGHVDHGKSTLVKALTGIDPDRLSEEKERGMTIDLGFAWLTLPSGREVSIVDVPGHESFIKNMLAGVGGIDAALLVVAADEGVMPQTREHLAILDLLRVPRGVVALTKIDLVDEEWLDLVREEILETLQGTTLADAPIIPVSAYLRTEVSSDHPETGHPGGKQGLSQLLTQLDRILNEAQERQNSGHPRLPVDRVFSMTGFGTVVTGTLLDGAFRIGQEVEILPQGIVTRIRGLQTHKQQIEVAYPGSRVAMNLANVARTDLARGNVVALPGRMRSTMLLDARIRLLADAERSLTHNMQVDFYCGSQEIPARVRLLDVEELLSGESAWVQLRLKRPAVVARRDRFILRVPSPAMTIGGGEVVEVQARYHRRHQQAVLAALERLEHGSPEELVLAALDRRLPLQYPQTDRKKEGASFIPQPAATPGSIYQGKPQRSSTFAPGSMRGLVGYELSEVARQANMAEDVTRQILETLLSEGGVCRAGVFWFARHIWDMLVDEAIGLAREYHRLHPLRSGLSKEEWRTRLNLSSRMANEVFARLQAEGHLAMVSGMGEVQEGMTLRTGGLLRLPDFTPRFTADQQQRVTCLLQRFRESAYTPPGRAEVEAMVGIEVLNALIEQGKLVKLSEDVLFLRETYDEAVKKLVNYLREHEKMTVGEARDVLGATRKYILPLLERMDVLAITRRRGDERVAGPGAVKIED